MIYIDPDTIIIFGLLTIFLIVLFSIGILGSRKRRIEEGKHSWLVTQKRSTLVVLVVAIGLVFLITLIFGRNVTSTIDISRLKTNINTCDKIIVTDRFVDFNDGTNDEVKKTITEPYAIKSLAVLISSAPFVRAFSRRMYRHSDYMEIELFQGNKRSEVFIIAHWGLSTPGKLGEQVYFCNRNENESLLDGLRKNLFPGRLLTWPNIGKPN